MLNFVSVFVIAEVLNDHRLHWDSQLYLTPQSVPKGTKLTL